MKTPALLFFLFCLGISLKGQDDAARLLQLAEKDSSTLPYLFSYPDSVREAIFIACSRPQGIIQLDEAQKASSTAFRKAVSGYGQDKQEELWDICRYPELPVLLLKNAGKKKSELKKLLQDYPEETRESAVYFAKHDTALLQETERIQQRFANRYGEIIKEYPPKTKKSFDVLIANPELVALLNKDMRTSLILGDLYAQHPAMVKKIADSMHTVIAKKQEAEYEDWKQNIGNDENAQQELKQASKKYIKDSRYEDDIYANKSYDVDIVYHVRPYPFWAGYPYWYAYPYWYPYPWWYNTGFYWRPHGPIVFWGMPTYHFGWWYYHQPDYHQHYPRASHYFDQHQNWGHPRGGGLQGAPKPPLVQPRK